MNNRNTTMTTKLYMLYSTRIFTSCMVGLWKLYPWNVPCNKQKRFSLPEAKARSDKRMTIWAFYIYIFHIWFGPFPSQTKCNFQATWKNLIQSIWEKSHHFEIWPFRNGCPFHGLQICIANSFCKCLTSIQPFYGAMQVCSSECNWDQRQRGLLKDVFNTQCMQFSPFQGTLSTCNDQCGCFCITDCNLN